MPIGRPSKLTPELIETVCNEVRLGMPFSYAAIRAGISEPTFHKYKNRGTKDLEAGSDSLEAEFLKRLKEALADFMHKSLVVISAAPQRWQAQMTLLERRFPAEFGRRMALDHGAQQGGEFTMSVKKADA